MATSKVMKWFISVVRLAMSAFAKASTVGDTSSRAKADIKAPAPKPHMAPTVDFDIGVVTPTMAPSTIEPAAIAPKMAAQITKVVPMSCIIVSSCGNTVQS